MKKMNIGNVISKRRKDKGITQEELAEYLGVSKPAVSKWESGQSYPDIMLLPVIASYFDISIDELLGYEAQMTAEDIKKTYLRLADEFSKEPFDKVYNECKEYIKSYYSCWDLLFSMAQLLLNHAPLAGSPERMNDTFKEVANIYKRIEEESGNAVISSQALTLRAYCYLALQQPMDAIDLLDGIEEAVISSELVLAKAYMMKGDLQKAKSTSQIFIYKNLLNLFSAFPDLMYYYSDNPEKMDEWLQKALDLGDVFGLKEMHPSLYFSTYLTAATLFAMQNQNDCDRPKLQGLKTEASNHYKLYNSPRYATADDEQE